MIVATAEDDSRVAEVESVVLCLSVGHSYGIASLWAEPTGTPGGREL